MTNTNPITLEEARAATQGATTFYKFFHLERTVRGVEMTGAAWDGTHTLAEATADMRLESDAASLPSTVIFDVRNEEIYTFEAPNTPSDSMDARTISDGAAPYDPSINDEIRYAWQQYQAAVNAAGDERFNEHSPPQKSLITRRFNVLTRAIQSDGRDMMNTLAHLASEEEVRTFTTNDGLKLPVFRQGQDAGVSRETGEKTSKPAPDQTRAAALATLGDRLFASLTPDNRRAVIVQIEACNTLRAALEGDAQADAAAALIVIDAALETGDAALCRALGAALFSGAEAEVTRYQVLSVSEPGRWHSVELHRGGASHCTCSARPGTCHHVKSARATREVRIAAGLAALLKEVVAAVPALRESKPVRQALAIRPEFAEQCRRPADVDYTAMFSE